MSSEPLYLQIKQFIDDNITSGRWPHGHRITTEVELANQFSVSRMTVNKAIRDLVNDGKLTRKPRAGTFVNLNQHKPESPLLDIRNISEEVLERGKIYSNKVIAQSSLKADDVIATKLGIMQGSPVYFSKIVHFEDETPIQLEVRWVNAHIVPDYINQDFTQFTPHQYLSNNCPLSAIEHTVEAIIGDEEINDALELSEGNACLLLKRRTWSNNALVSSALLYHPGNNYKLSSKIMID